MEHDWKEMYVDTDTIEKGNRVILKFVDDDTHDINTFTLDKDNIKWLRKALKRAAKLAALSD